MLPVTNAQILLIACLYLGLITVVGFAAMCVCLRKRDRHWVEVLAGSYGLGAGIFPLILFVFSVAGFKPSRAILTGIAIVAVATIFVLGRKGRLLRPSVPAPRHRFDAFTVLGLLSAGLIATAMGNIAAHSAWPGLQDIDAFAIWMFKAKVLAIEALRPMPVVFGDPILSYSHQDYPLSFPLLTAGLYAALGRVDDSAAKLLLVPNWLALTGIFYAAVRRFHRRAIAISVTAVFCTAPTLISNASLLVAETPLILALTGTVALLLRWVEEAQSGDLMLAGLFAVSAAFVKNEGLALLPVFAVAGLIFSLARRQLRDFTLIAGVCGSAILPWLIWRMVLPRTHEDYGGKLLRPSIFIQLFPERSWTVTVFIARLFDGPRAGLIWYALVITAILGYRALRTKSAWLLWGLLIAQLTLYCATFIVTPWNVRDLIPMITPKLQTQASMLPGLLIAINLRQLYPLRNDRIGPIGRAANRS